MFVQIVPMHVVRNVDQCREERLCATTFFARYFHSVSHTGVKYVYAGTLPSSVWHSVTVINCNHIV